jgi:hypothetical protein
VIVVGTTLCSFAMSQPYGWEPWLYNAEGIKASLGEKEDIKFFAAIQTDARGSGIFGPLVRKLEAIGGEYWFYSLDDGRTKVTTQNRLRHLCAGQNLVTDYACSVGASHLLFMAADCSAPPDALPKLLEVDHGLVGGEVATYCFNGDLRPEYPFPVYEHMPTAAFVLIARSVFKRLRWRWDAEDGMSDDPAYAFDAETLLGVKGLIRKDCVGRHYPECIGSIEQRGYDLEVVR